ncbi:hypothetical protein MZM54_00205 [[Brevibacterium] frigoritolerans]|nr:hypothetical protein [Peribacillus frigoritolerans]
MSVATIKMNIGHHVKRKNGECFPDGKMVATIEGIIRNPGMYEMRTEVSFKEYGDKFRLELEELEKVEVEETEFLDNLTALWDKDELTEVAYQISNLYSSMDRNRISETMTDFQKRVDKFYWKGRYNDRITKINIGNKVKRKNDECFPDGEMVAAIKNISNSTSYFNQKQTLVWFKDYESDFSLELEELEKMEVQETEFLDELTILWDKEEITEVAYQISNLYSSMDYRRISETMKDFKRRVETKKYRSKW